MASYELEIILTRQFADSLSLPIFITDPEGNLLFYNEPAEEILGQRFEETGSLSVKEWPIIFNPVDPSGNRMEPSELPLVRTLGDQTPHQGSFWIENLVGDRHLIMVSSFPIIGRANRYLGAFAIFWNEKKE